MAAIASARLGEHSLRLGVWLSLQGVVNCKGETMTSLWGMRTEASWVGTLPMQFLARPGFFSRCWLYMLSAEAKEILHPALTAHLSELKSFTV